MAYVPRPGGPKGLNTRTSLRGEVGHVAGDQDETPRLGRGGQEAVDDRERVRGVKARPSLCDASIGVDDAIYQDGPKVAAVLADLESAPVEEGLRATLRMLGKLTREEKVGAEDRRQVLSAGVSRQQVEDALAVCAAFNTTDRLADAFGFKLLSPEGFEAGAKYLLLKRGYR